MQRKAESVIAEVAASTKGVKLSPPTESPPVSDAESAPIVDSDVPTISVRRLASIFRRLGDEKGTNLSIIFLLLRQPRTPSQLALAVGIRAESISSHLLKLRLAGLVSAVEDGHFRRYEVNPNLAPEIHELVDLLIPKQ